MEDSMNALNQIFNGQSYSNLGLANNSNSILNEFQNLETQEVRIDFTVCQIFTVPEQKKYLFWIWTTLFGEV
jgi:hypothetical protein